jgi:hypothetical protein
MRLALAIRALRATGATIAIILAVGGIPGAHFRPVVHDIALAPMPSDAPGPDGKVDVAVRGEAGGPPIAGAHIRAYAIVDDRAYLADMREADKNGRAALRKLPRGALWIIADSPGRARGSTRIVVDADSRFIEIELAPEHAIDVVARDDQGVPIGGAEIELVGSDDPLPLGARTTADGTAHVSRLGVGPWRVTVRALGYEEGSGRAAHDGDTVLVVLRKLGALVVRVVRGGDRSVSGARVAVAGATLWPARVTETDAHGEVRIGGLAAGLYALRATRGDLVSAIDLGIALGRGEEKSIVLRLVEGRWVGVRVTDGDDDAQGIAAARVTLAEGGLSPFPLEATTDAKGAARLGPIASGGATLGVRADGFVPRGGVPIADPPPPETRVALVRAGALAGRIVDDRGFPIDGATIEIAGTDSNGAPILDDPRRASFQVAQFDAMLGGPVLLVPAGELGVMPGPVPAVPLNTRSAGVSPRAARAVEPWVTRADGTFRAAPASPGRVRAIVHHALYVEAQSEVVTVAPGSEAHVDIVMHQGGALEGRVVDARDRPVGGARVLVSAARGSLERTTRTASDGTFAFAGLPESVSVTTAMDAEDQPDVRMLIAVPERGRREVTIRLPEPRGALAVTVVDDRDWPVQAAQVTASSLSADVPLRATTFTDAHGEAVLKRARGVPLRIEASSPGHAPRIVTADASGDAVRIVLAAAETATGEVIAAGRGDAIASAEVTLYTDLGVRRAHTDVRGTFALSELAPGGASLHVRAPGFAAMTRPVTIPDSAGRRPFVLPRVELFAEGVVEGDVVDTRGDPVAGARVAKDHAPTWLVVGVAAECVAVTDAKGRFSLGELPEGTVALEAYAPDFGRARLEGVKVVRGRTTSNVHIVLAQARGEEREKRSSLPAATGSVAVTLGETGAPVQVVILSVAAGSEAERAGLAPGDVVLAVDDAPVHAIEEAREKLSGTLSDDVIVRIKRGDREMLLRVGREPVRR